MPACQLRCVRLPAVLCLQSQRANSVIESRSLSVCEHVRGIAFSQLKDLIRNISTVGTVNNRVFVGACTSCRLFSCESLGVCEFWARACAPIGRDRDSETERFRRVQEHRSAVIVNDGTLYLNRCALTNNFSSFPGLVHAADGGAPRLLLQVCAPVLPPRVPRCRPQLLSRARASSM